METETIDRLFLELSQVTRATTSKELALQALVDQLRAENARLREAMPSERLLSELEESIDEWDGYTDMQKHARDWVVKARLARLDAARKGVL